MRVSDVHRCTLNSELVKTGSNEIRRVIISTMRSYSNLSKLHARDGNHHLRWFIKFLVMSFAMRNEYHNNYNDML